MRDPMLRSAIVSLTKRATRDGKLIEAGWLGYRLTVMHDNSPQIQLDQCRQAFFAGAQHLFGSMMSIMDEDREPTQADMIRMGQISDELDRFIEVFCLENNLPPPTTHNPR
jgi:hypothetical protein